jgi:hypothetical protein
MNTTKILISVEQRLERQLIEYSLDRYSDVEIVGRSLNVIEIMALIVQRKPHVWIHSLSDGTDLRKIRSHIYAIAPELVIANVDPNEPCGYLQVPINSIDELVSHAIRFSESSDTTFVSNQQF